MIIRIQNKAARYPIGHGYDRRTRGINKYTILLHTTNGNIGSSYANEVDYLYRSKKVSAHYIISKQGIITQLLPIEYRAWHAGAVKDKIFNNNGSIGIEMHFTPGENKDLPLMNSACINLCKLLREHYTIIGIDAHRIQAIPERRKLDPSHLNDEEFQVLKNRILSDFRTVKKGTQIYTDTTLIRKATHINTPEIKAGMIMRDSVYDVSLLHTCYWLTNGFGFVNKNAIL